MNKHFLNRWTPNPSWIQATRYVSDSICDDAIIHGHNCGQFIVSFAISWNFIMVLDLCWVESYSHLRLRYSPNCRNIRSCLGTSCVYPANPNLGRKQRLDLLNEIESSVLSVSQFWTVMQSEKVCDKEIEHVETVRVVCGNIRLQIFSFE